MLVNLSYLNLDTHKLKKMSPGDARVSEKLLSGDASGLQKMPPGILPKLSKLQYLKFNWISDTFAAITLLQCYKSAPKRHSKPSNMQMSEYNKFIIFETRIRFEVYVYIRECEIGDTLSFS